MSLDLFLDLPPLWNDDHVCGIANEADSQTAAQPSLTDLRSTQVAQQSIPSLQTSGKRKRKVIDLTAPNASMTQPVHLSPDELLSNRIAMPQPGLVREESIMLPESLRPSSPQEAQRKPDENEKEMEETQEKMKENREIMCALVLRREKTQSEINGLNSSSLSIPPSSSSSSSPVGPPPIKKKSKKFLKIEALAVVNKIEHLGVRQVLAQKIVNPDADISDLCKGVDNISTSTFARYRKKLIRNAPAHLKVFLKKIAFKNKTRN